MGNDIKVKVKLLRDVALPQYATDGAAALDLRAAMDEEFVVIAPGGRALIPTGIAIAPQSADVVAILAARSGLAVKHGIMLANGIGVIDSDYRGEIKVALHNHGDVERVVDVGERVAQLVITPYLRCDFECVEELDDTERGNGGFGSTGTK